MELSLCFLFSTAVCLCHGNTLQNAPTFNTLESTEDVLGSAENSAEQFEDGITNKDNTFSWAKVSSGTSLPGNAVVGGIDDCCGKLYVARAVYEGYLVPGKFCESDGHTHVDYKGSEIAVGDSEVLCSDEVFWQPTTGGRIPAEAIVVGKLTNEEILYAGRAFVGDYLTPGMVQPSTNTIKMSYGGTLYTSKNYEILVSSPRAYRWETVLYLSSSEIPKDAVIGGFDTNTNCGKVYVARAWHEGQLLPAKLCGKDQYAYITHNGIEVKKTESEVLCSNHILWVKNKNNEIPSNALEVGFTAEGEKLFSGRGFVGTKVLPGKVQPSTNLLYMAYDSKEHQTSEYEVLTLV